MAENGSRRVIVAAMAANLAIAAVKFVAAAITGSSAMVSEAIHSLVDTGDGLLLYVGTRRAARAPDEQHPFGHGKELYFWTLVVAVLVFAVGGGMSIYEGISHLVAPHPLVNPAWNYAVLGASLLFEAVSWVIAARHFAEAKGNRSVWRTIRSSKDPTRFAVLLEDTAALIGLAVALVGVTLTHATGNPRYDGAASILIGLMLMAVAVALARETMRMVIGESTHPSTIRAVREMAAAEPLVARVGRATTVHFGPDDVLLMLEVCFRGDATMNAVAGAIDRLERAIRARFPELKYVFVNADAAARA